MNRRTVILTATHVAVIAVAIWAISSWSLGAGKPLTEFSLPLLRDDEQRFDRHVLIGKASMINVWGSWCVACRREHPVLMDIARSADIPLYGLNYKDTREDAIRWLDRLGDPYTAIIFDPNGELAHILGVDAAPETYLLDPQGRTVVRHVGALSPQIWHELFAPEIEKLQAHLSVDH